MRTKVCVGAVHYAVDREERSRDRPERVGQGGAGKQDQQQQAEDWEGLQGARGGVDLFEHVAQLVGR